MSIDMSQFQFNKAQQEYIAAAKQQVLLRETFLEAERAVISNNKRLTQARNAMTEKELELVYEYVQQLRKDLVRESGGRK